MSENAFFVGYKSIPTVLKRFYRWIVVAGLVFSAVAGFTLASPHEHAGEGLWETAEKVTMEGLLTLDPYPLLHRASETDPQQTESIMIVMLGKHAATGPATEFSGSQVAISGFLVQRGGWLMLEIEGDGDISAVSSPAQPVDPDATVKQPLGSITLTGEIMDSKCFLGVMKPGHGRVHKACAELCLLGGIPPMLVVRDESDTKFGYLLTQSDGSSASELVAKLAAEPVELTGELVQQGDILSIRIQDNKINRL